MFVILFGTTGMVGQGALRACLDDPVVEGVLSVVRTPSGVTHPKMREVVHRDFLNFTPVEAEFAAYDACFFCVGVSSAGMDEATYRLITHDFTLAAARSVLRQNHRMVFLYVSGEGTDSTGQGGVMWARVKGQTENELLALARSFMLRPGYIQPVDGAVSRTRLYRVIYAVAGPLYPVLRALFPRHVLTTTELGRAMVRVAREGAPARVLDAPALVALAQRD